MCGDSLVLYYVNDTSKAFFRSKRDLRRGDPFSSYFLIIMEEVLTRLIKVEFEAGRIGHFYHPKGYSIIFYLLYADDLLVFTDGTRRSMRNLLLTLDKYERWFGQSISKATNTIDFWTKINTIWRRGLKRVLGFMDRQFPFTYLGAPMISGHMMRSQFDYLVQRIQNEVVS